MAEAVIRIEDLHHDYGGRPIYQGLDLCVEAGSVFGLLGKNGVGKSTLINILMGYLQPRRGRCLIFGEPSHDLPVQTRRRIALLHEGFVSYDFMTIGQIEAFFVSFHPGWQPAIFRELIALMDLPGNRRLRSLSCGQKSQVVLGLLLAQDADLLILDDYSMGLDAGYRRLFTDYLREYLRGTDKSVLITSHVMGDLEQLIDRFVIVERNQPVYRDSMANFRQTFRGYESSEPLPPGSARIASDHQAGQDAAPADRLPLIHRQESLAGRVRFYSFAPRSELERKLAVPISELPLTFEDQFLGYVGKY